MFIPSILNVVEDIKETTITAPRLIRNNDCLRSWFQKDQTFLVPKANIFISCKIPLAIATVGNTLKTRVYTVMVMDILEEYSYNPKLAGLKYSLSPSSIGLDIHFSGYNDKLHLLVEKVLATMRKLEYKLDRFEVVKKKLLEDMENWHYKQPFNQTWDLTLLLNSERGFNKDELFAELHQLTADDFSLYYPQLLKQMKIEMLTCGNVCKEDVLRLTNLVESTLEPSVRKRAEWPISRSLIFPPGGDFVYRQTLEDPENVNNCIEYFLYIGDRAIRPLQAKVLLFHHMAREPAFDKLQTTERLGYIIYTHV